MPAVQPAAAQDLCALRFAPAILFLGVAPQVAERCLAGDPPQFAEALPLRDDVSTDEITPLPILTHYDDKLGRYPYTGFKAGDRLPIGTDAIRTSRTPASFSAAGLCSRDDPLP